MLESFARIRSYVSIHQLTFAVELALAAKDREHPEWEEDDHGLACAGGAILCAIAFLEATVNELWHDVICDESPPEPVEYHFPLCPNLRGGSLAKVLTAGPDLSRYPTLERFQLTLAACACEKFDAGADPYQSAALAIKIRNELTHYRPSWRSLFGEGKLDGALSSKLGAGFLRHPGLETSYDHLGGMPFGCLTKSCGTFVVRACGDFVLEFHRRMEGRLEGWRGPSDPELIKSELERLAAHTMRTPAPSQNDKEDV